MKKIICYSIFAIALFMGCREKEILTALDFYTNDIPVKNPTDSTWLKKIKIDQLLPFKGDSLVVETYFGVQKDIKVPAVNYQNLVYFKLKPVDVKLKTYKVELYFNATPLKALIAKYTNEAKKIHGDFANVELYIGIAQSEDRIKYRSFETTFSPASKYAGTSVNIDLMQEGEFCNYEYLCKYYQNGGISCIEPSSYSFRPIFYSGEKIQITFRFGVGPDSRVVGGGYTSTLKIFLIDPMNL